MAGKPNTKWLATMVKKHGSLENVIEIQRANASKGGKKTGIKGFAVNPEMAKIWGAKGGRISRRTKKLI